MATKLLIEAIREGLTQEMEADERVFVLGEDVGTRGGVFRVTQTATSFSSHFFSIPGPALPVSRTSPDSIDTLNEIYSVY